MRRRSAAIAVLTWVFKHLPVNPTTVALSFLLVVLLLASRWGLTIATTTAVVATLAFNYFFLPPVHTFTIAETAKLDRPVRLSGECHSGQPPLRARPP